MIASNKFSNSCNVWLWLIKVAPLFYSLLAACLSQTQPKIYINYTLEYSNVNEFPERDHMSFNCTRMNKFSIVIFPRVFCIPNIIIIKLHPNIMGEIETEIMKIYRARTRPKFYALFICLHCTQFSYWTDHRETNFKRQAATQWHWMSEWGA